jgi:rare lipoprotein A
MLVKTRKTISADKDADTQDGRRRRYAQVSRRLLHGLVATLLLGVAPAYAEPIRNLRIASRQTNKRVELENDQSPRLPQIESAEIPFDTEHDSTVVGRGIASWYSADRYNRRTYSGVPFDENAMTAAHPWLPMGTRLRVTLQGSNQSIVVTINDRQGTKTRVIDLSKRAARELGILDRGIARVTLTRF